MPPFIQQLLNQNQQVQVENKVNNQYLQPSDKEQSFLDQMAQIESSNGQNTDHPRVPSGIQKGDAAVGKYGLMPNTLKELVNSAVNNNDSSPIIQQLKDKNPDELASAVQQNPDLEKEMALRLERRIMSRPGITTPEQANYMWQYGHNLTGKQLDERDYMNSDRAQKFQKLRDQLDTLSDNSSDKDSD